MWVFLVVSISLIASIVFFMPKNISKIELYISYFFMLILSWSLNVVIDAKYSLRGFFQKGPDFSTMLIYIILFPCLGVIFLNFYPYTKKSLVKKTSYFIFALLLMLAYDALLVKFNILHYYNWNYGYSIVLYTIDFVFILLNKKVIYYL
jgi:hypothetical protein